MVPEEAEESSGLVLLLQWYIRIPLAPENLRSGERGMSEA